MRVTTSKLILIVDFTLAIILAGIVCVGSFCGADTSNIAIVAGLWDAQLAVAIGFYYWKAKNENRSRYAMELVKNLAETYGIENVVSLAEIILKD